MCEQNMASVGEVRKKQGIVITENIVADMTRRWERNFEDKMLLEMIKVMTWACHVLKVSDVKDWDNNAEVYNNGTK